MKYKTYITRFKNKFLKKRPVVQDPQLMHPDREWAIGLVIAVLIFSCCGLWSIHSYLKNRNAAALPVEDSSEQTVYRESIVKNALESVARRKETFEALTNEPNELPAQPEAIGETEPAIVETAEPVEEIESEASAVPVLGE